MIDARDQAVLRDVVRVAGGEGICFFVIGAGARFLVHDWPNQLTDGRGTTDWDVAVHVASWEQFHDLREALCAGSAPFTRSSAEHRVVHATGRHLDLIPFGAVEQDDRTVTYPLGQTSHSVLGLLECESVCQDVEIGGGVSVSVVATPGLVLLKAQAYLDRRPNLTYDVRDLDFICRTYGDGLGDTTVFERAADMLRSERVTYEDVGAFLLARDVASLEMPRAVLAPLVDVLAELVENDGVALEHLLGRRAYAEATARLAVVRRYAAFQLGLDPV